jgi:cysteine synthase
MTNRFSEQILENLNDIKPDANPGESSLGAITLANILYNGLISRNEFFTYLCSFNNNYNFYAHLELFALLLAEMSDTEIDEFLATFN